MKKIIIRKATYDHASVGPAVFEALDSFLSGTNMKGARVVIKPNLLSPSPPEAAIVTHPAVVRAAAQYVLQRGAHAQVSDSPAVGSFERILKESGIREALKGLDVKTKEFKEKTPVEIGPPFGKIPLAKDAVEADFLINLPKLKTHTHMLLTLGVKNLFGAVVGLEKPEWHLRAGVDREMFARLLLQIHYALKPSVTLIDAIVAMEGQGPGKRGTPRRLGLLFAGNDAASLDIAISEILGIRPDEVPTNKAALDAGLAEGDVIIEGEIPRVGNFRLPVITHLVAGPPAMRGFIRRHLTQRPVCEVRLCRRCEECVRYCPAKAITDTGKTLRFDYDRCIRCYCCLEVCPHGAISAKETPAGMILRKVFKR